MRPLTLKQLWRIRRLAPRIVIFEYGAGAAEPKVTVGFGGLKGVCAARTYDADASGHAKATVDAKIYSKITGLPVIDQRAGG